MSFIQDFSSRVKTDWQSILQFFKEFLKSPLPAVRQIPDWHWQSLLVLLTSLSALSGVLSGLVARSATQMFAGLFLLPISAVLMTFVFAGFFYYTFLFFSNQHINFKHCYTLVVISSLPLLAIHTVSPLLPPLSIVGAAFSGILLIVGFVEFFKLPRKPVIRVIGSLFIVYILMWVFSSLQIAERKKRINFESSPESLDILEREFKKTTDKLKLND